MNVLREDAFSEDWYTDFFFYVSWNHRFREDDSNIIDEAGLF